ncbi:MAG: restriction endonuclease subunit S, partial [Desulfarculus sp.]|nr:restriction endonuclease subunit S [Pseudomonadota bacterium]MBV1753597.1 restriction endonuclease subunit S [Desulfarculus sp.]
MSFPEYRGYSACEIPGVAKLPKQWKALKLKHLASIKFSNVDKNKEEGEQPVSLCNYVDVYHNEWITPELDFMEATASQREIDKFSLKVGDVLVTKDSESWDDIAVPAYVASETESTLCGYHLAQIRPKPEAIDGRYLFRAFDAQAINDQFKVAANGITRFGLGKYWLDNALFPVPPLQDQRAIADFLDRETARIDELIAKKQRQIELLQEKRAAVISHAVTKGLNPDAKMKDSGIEWLGEIPEHWSIGAIAWIGRVMNGSTPSNSKPDYWEDGSVPWVSSAEVNQGLIVNPTAYITEQA